MLGCGTLKSKRGDHEHTQAIGYVQIWEAPDASSGEPETVWGDKLTDDEYPAT